MLNNALFIAVYSCPVSDERCSTSLNHTYTVALFCSVTVNVLLQVAIIIVPVANDGRDEEVLNISWVVPEVKVAESISLDILISMNL